MKAVVQNRRKSISGDSSQNLFPVLPAIEQPVDGDGLSFNRESDSQSPLKTHNTKAGADVLTQNTAFGRKVQPHAKNFDPFNISKCDGRACN